MTTLLLRTWDSAFVAVSRDAAVVAEYAIPEDIYIDAPAVLSFVTKTLRDVSLTKTDRIAVVLGSGPYSRVRVGVMVAQMLGLAWGVPVFATSGSAAREALDNVVEDTSRDVLASLYAEWQKNPSIGA